MQSLTLVLPYPVSSNRYWAHRVVKPKGGKPMALVYVTPEAKEYRERVALIVRSAGVRLPITGRVRLRAELYPSRPQDWQRRMRKLGETWDDSVQCIDLGNAEKVMSDALQGIVIADDCMFRRIVLDRMEPDDKGARLVVHVDRVELRAPQGDLLGAAA